eukprot:742257-Karenia_brevis.AAC.1
MKPGLSGMEPGRSLPQKSFPLCNQASCYKGPASCHKGLWHEAERFRHRAGSQCPQLLCFRCD